MKKIGFIDYFIDEWHASLYPTLIREGAYKDRFDVAMAWAKIRPDGKKSLAEWCEEKNVRQAESIKEVVDACDCLVVLSPDNPEQHEELADLPLRSGKIVYIDKPISPTLTGAVALFEKAEKHGTAVMSSSALRYGSAFDTGLKSTFAGKRVHHVSTRGNGSLSIYAIHQVEMIVAAMGTGASRVMHCGSPDIQHIIIDYVDGRRSSFTLMAGQPLQASISYGENEALIINEITDHYPGFVNAMLEFFDTGIPSASMEETLEIAAILEAGVKALELPDRWVTLPSY